jgi:hypothetical protein
LDLARVGNNSAAKMAIIAITTSNSINVKADRLGPNDLENAFIAATFRTATVDIMQFSGHFCKRSSESVH